MLYFSIVLKKLAKFFRGLLFLAHPYINCRMYSENDDDEYHYPRRARSALGVDTVLTLDVCLYVCMLAL